MLYLPLLYRHPQLDTLMDPKLLSICSRTWIHYQVNGTRDWRGPRGHTMSHWAVQQWGSCSCPDTVRTCIWCPLRTRRPADTGGRERPIHSPESRYAGPPCLRPNWSGRWGRESRGRRSSGRRSWTPCCTWRWTPRDTARSGDSCSWPVHWTVSRGTLNYN